MVQRESGHEDKTRSVGKSRDRPAHETGGITAGILALLVLLSASATAEYEQYRLAVPDEKDAVQLWEVFPLDAHNVIVRMYSPDVPWYVNWYRDLSTRFFAQRSNFAVPKGIDRTTAKHMKACLEIS